MKLFLSLLFAVLGCLPAIAQTGNVKVNPNTGALISPSAATFRSANSIGSSSAALPTGGTTGQALTKSSGTNYAVTWSDVLTSAAIGSSIQGWHLTLEKFAAVSLGAIGPVTYNTGGPGFFTVSSWASARANVFVNSTPASASATGTAGEIRWDADFVYVCTATNTWKRVAIATW